jgi:hypothetical protein
MPRRAPCSILYPASGGRRVALINERSGDRLPTDLKVRGWRPDEMRSHALAPTQTCLDNQARNQ